MILREARYRLLSYPLLHRKDLATNRKGPSQRAVSIEADHFIGIDEFSDSRVHGP
jgi:hypothetical protein